MRRTEARLYLASSKLLNPPNDVAKESLLYDVRSRSNNNYMTSECDPDVTVCSRYYSLEGCVPDSDRPAPRSRSSTEFYSAFETCNERDDSHIYETILFNNRQMETPHDRLSRPVSTTRQMEARNHQFPYKGRQGGLSWNHSLKSILCL